MQRLWRIVLALGLMAASVMAGMTYFTQAPIDCSTRCTEIFQTLEEVK